MSEQKTLAKLCFDLGAKGFYECHNEKTQHMKMMNMGRKINGKMHAQSIPQHFIDEAAKISALVSTQCAYMPRISPDIGVVNFYSVSPCARPRCLCLHVLYDLVI